MFTLVTAVLVLLVLLAALNVVIAFGVRAGLRHPPPIRSEHQRAPEEFDLPYEEISYGPDRVGWWIPMRPDSPTVVFVHGYDGFRGADFDPLLDVAAACHGWGYNSLLIDLGYLSGAHRYSGGVAEADDIIRAVRWAASRTTGRIALMGASAGGHACLIAAASSVPVAAVITDGAFVDTCRMATRLAARLAHIPSGLLCLTPLILDRIGFPRARVDLRSVLHQHPIQSPVLLIHGDADRVVPIQDQQRIASLASAVTCTIPSGGHCSSHMVNPADYLATVHDFLDAYLSPDASL